METTSRRTPLPRDIDPAPLRVLFFGTASTVEGKPRTRVLRRGLRECGVEIVDCRQPLWPANGERELVAKSLFSARNLAHLSRAQLALGYRFLRAPHHDLILVGAEGQLDIVLVRLLTLGRRRPVVFDPFVSLYDTVVEDRGLVPTRSLRARLLRWLDWFACRLADAVLLDTDAMIRHYVQDFQVPAEKLHRVLVGEEPELFAPAGEEPLPEPAAPPLRVVWFGTHIPLHGVPVIVAAAAALRNAGIEFVLIGTGQGLAQARAQANGLPHVTFIPRFLPAAELRDQIHQAHVGLGIFGTTAKAGRVIPCKVYDVLSAGRPLVTADTPAIRELLQPGREAILVPSGDPQALADALLVLRDDAERRSALARAGLRLFRARATPAVLGAELVRILDGVCLRA
jgi:glycosyltransferase involved in cell wall biosynthesis